MTQGVQELIEEARAAAIDAAGDADSVGPHLTFDASAGDGYGAHTFACTLPGYRGWAWHVIVALPEGDAPTVSEACLLPGSDALLAPAWVPWAERVRPGDLEPAMVLPYVADDPRLVQGFEVTDDADDDAMELWEWGMGRARMLGPEGRTDAAERWYRGTHGPTAAAAIASTQPCASCAFFVAMPGSFRAMFGVCSNEWSASDGKVVSLDHGCGAHSETEAEAGPSQWPAADPVLDTAAVDGLDLAEPDPEPEAVEPEAVEPEAVEPEAAEPDNVEPEAFEPDFLPDPAFEHAPAEEHSAE